MPRRWHVAAVVVATAIAAAWVLWQFEHALPGAPAASQPALTIVSDGETFGPGRPRRLELLGTAMHGAGAPLRCRWVPAHADVVLSLAAPGDCIAVVSFDPQRTRRSRFELDPWMGVDVIVSAGGERVGVASTRLRFTP